MNKAKTVFLVVVIFLLGALESFATETVEKFSIVLESDVLADMAASNGPSRFLSRSVELANGQFEVLADFNNSPFTYKCTPCESVLPEQNTSSEPLSRVRCSCPWPQSARLVRFRIKTVGFSELVLNRDLRTAILESEKEGTRILHLGTIALVPLALPDILSVASEPFDGERLFRFTIQNPKMEEFLIKKFILKGRWSPRKHGLYIACAFPVRTPRIAISELVEVVEKRGEVLRVRATFLEIGSGLRAVTKPQADGAPDAGLESLSLYREMLGFSASGFIKKGTCGGADTITLTLDTDFVVPAQKYSRFEIVVPEELRFVMSDDAEHDPPSWLSSLGHFDEIDFVLFTDRADELSLRAYFSYPAAAEAAPEDPD